MRTTIRLDQDVAMIIDQLRREQHISMSDAVNRLVRAGAKSPQTGPADFHQRTVALGAPAVDLTNVAEVLDLLDEGDET